MHDPSVIDLSHWNTVDDFGTVRAAGVLGVIHKATEGAGYVDSTYHERKGAALDAGLLWGAYHFLKPEASGGAQMEHFLNVAELPPGGRIALDYEAPGLEIEVLHDCLDWLFIHAPAMQVCIYGGHLIKEQLGSAHDKDLAETSLWLAQYTTGAPSWPSGTWPYWTLWQFTDEATVPGIIGPVDGNRFNGSAKGLVEWFGRPTAPRHWPDRNAGLVVLNVVAPPGVELGIIVNGRVIK